jgi:uncharacterized membrane protein
MVGFFEEILPALIVLWAAIVLAFLIWRQDFLLPVGVWATVTALMLWPVGRRLGRTYSSYRRPLFLLGVLSMAALPTLGFFLQFLPPTTHHEPYVPRTWVLLAVVAVLTTFSAVAAARAAIGKPIGMFFRPDVLFGDGRVLGTGMIALGLSMRFLFADFPEMPPHIASPKGNWWGIAFAIVFGLVQIIPLRGMFKLRLRLARVLEDRWTGWGAIILREGWLVLATLALLFGFHNVFKGTVPLIQPSLAGLEEIHFREAGLPGLISTALAALFIIFVRGGYKKAIGDPFLKETLRQSIVKAALFLVGFFWLFYSFAHVMEEQPFGSGPNTEFYPAIIGWSLLVWGVLMLGPIRIWAQRNQRLAIVKQMVAVLLPAQPPEKRKEVMLKVMHALTECPADQRLEYMRAMQEALNEAPEDVRQLMTEVRMECLVELPAEKRRTLMAAMDQLTAGA